MTQNITFRNFSTRPLTLKSIERFDPPSTPASTSFAANITAVFSNVTSSSSHRNTSLAAITIPSAADRVSHEDCDLPLPPLRTQPTQVPAYKRIPTQVVRLTFEDTHGGPLRIDISSATASIRAQSLVRVTKNDGDLPESNDHQHSYFALYVPASALLAIFEHIDTQQWMREFRDNTPVSALSIPGTHNSPTYHLALPSVRCQAVSPLEQLHHGVRFFDIRVQPIHSSSDGAMNLVHGAFPVALSGAKKFRAMLDEVYDFLDANLSETIIMSIKREGVNSGTDQELSILLKKHYIDADSDRWYTEPRVPQLGEVRGKIILLRRFLLDQSAFRTNAWGLNAERWAQNTAECTAGDVCVQDFFEVLEPSTISKKIVFCCAQFERAASVVHTNPTTTRSDAAAGSLGPLYLNFLSASNFWNPQCWPERVAAKLNPAIVKFLCEQHDFGDHGLDAPRQTVIGDGGVGVVICDWVGHQNDWDLVNCILGMNGRLWLKQQDLS